MAIRPQQVEAFVTDTVSREDTACHVDHDFKRTRLQGRAADYEQAGVRIEAAKPGRYRLKSNTIFSYLCFCSLFQGLFVCPRC